MGFKNCIQCGTRNQDTEERCTQCGAGMASWMDSEITVKRSRPDEPQMEDERTATVMHGLRSGAIGGALIGLLYNFLRKSTLGEASAFLCKSLAGPFASSATVLLLTVLTWIVFGMLLGAFLAATQELCYRYDAARVGSWLGGAWGVLAWLTGYATMIGIVWMAAFGALAGITIYYVEMRWFRNRYAELV